MVLRRISGKKRTRLLAIFGIAAAGLALAVYAGDWLIVDEPQKADTIVVLAGETDRRPTRALELLRQGYARRIVLDVPADASIYGTSQIKLAEGWAQGLPESASIIICPIIGLSTRDESHDVVKCLASKGENHILIVTSDFHTRRARSIFRHELPGRTFSIAAARDDTQFGAHWWTHRQWAKTCVDEWLRLLWWQAVDRWR